MGYSYKKLYEKSAAFYMARPKAKKGLLLFDKLLTAGFGAAYLTLWIYGAFWGNFSVNDFIRITFIPLSTLFLVSILRIMFARPRPYSAKGSGIIPLKKRSGHEEDSFPSRHLACAAAITACFLPVLPLVGGGMLALCIALGYIRFALGFHYPSDLLAGGALGCLVTCFYYFLEYIFSIL